MRKRLMSYKLSKEINDKNYLIDETVTSLINAVKDYMHNKVNIGVLFSGGVDSTIIALILQKLSVDFTCYTSGLKDSSDVKWAESSAKIHGFKHRIKVFNKSMVEKELPVICRIIRSNNVIKAGVAVPFYFAAQMAEKDGVKLLFSGLGSEELYAGYERFTNVKNVNKECLHGLHTIYERDLTRDLALMKHFNIKPALPFLNHNLIRLALKTPGEYKIDKNYKKLMVRWAASKLGVDKSIVWRRKKAAQYGSGSDKILEKLAKPLTKTEYLQSIYNPKPYKLGVLFSGGKDSSLALYKMQLQGHDIKCLICMLSDNPASYMFHPSEKRVVSLQSKSMRIPLIFGNTKGLKEEELKDLKRLIKTAKRGYKLDGVVTGALFSDYQSKRIEKICKELKLKCFSPLWHMNQEDELKELLRLGFDFIMISVAALGLNKTWLNKTITHKEISRLKELEKKYGLNMAGEGGEYESLVLNAPMFNKALKITKSEIIEEDENTAKLLIKHVLLV